MPDSDKSSSNTATPILENDIGLRIKAAREAHKLSQMDMHNRTGLSRTVLINYEAGRHKPGAREIRLICDTLQVSPNYLIYGTEEPHKIEEGLSQRLLHLSGGDAFMHLSVLVPVLAALLGHDEKRLILDLTETIIKAKSPEVWNDVLSILDAFPKASEIDIEKAAAQSLPPEKVKEMLERTKQNITNLPKKSS